MTTTNRRRPEGADQPGKWETLVGALLVGCAILGGIVIAAHPQQNLIDRWGFELIADSPHSTTLSRITDTGSAAVLAIGTILAALICVRRDRRRAAACILGPVLCAISVELVFKPLVGRRFEQVLTYPSGSVADVAAVATAWVLAVPARIRPVFAALAAVVVGAMFTAVIGLRWHLTTDALAGVVLGVGVVLLVDGVLHLRSREAGPGDRGSVRADEQRRVGART